MDTISGFLTVFLYLLLWAEKCCTRGSIINHFSNLDGQTDANRNVYGCLEDNIRPQTNFDITSFMGVWIAIAQTVPINEYTLESGITAHLYRGDHQFQVKHAGYVKDEIPYNSGPISHKRQNRCVGPSVLECWEDFNQTGNIHAHFLDRGGEVYSNTSFKIVYTDYNVSILYSCHKLDPSGKKCLPDYAMVSINSRQNEIPEPKWCKMMAFIKNELCINPNKLRIISRDYDCKHMLGLENGIEEYNNYNKRSPSKLYKKRMSSRQKRSANTMEGIHEECLIQLSKNGVLS